MTFVTIDVTDEIEEQARAIRADRDKLYGNIYIEAPSDLRWVGEIGEIVFNQWASEASSATLEWITDKAAGKPDFVIGGRAIDVKTVKRKVAPRLNYTAQITARHAAEPVDDYFFTSYEFQRRRLWLLGGLDKETFLEGAKYYGPGDQVHANYTVRPGHEIYNIEIEKLVPPNRWLESLIV